MGIFSRIKHHEEKRERRQAEDRAQERFQVCEYDGELWLTDGILPYCPCSMLNVGPVEAVKKLRELYVKRFEG